MTDDTCDDTLKLKQVIIDEGLYERGMSLEDMQQIYKTLNRSKRTANEEVEYRELLSQTNINCSNLDLLKAEDDDTDINGDRGTVVFASTPEKSTVNNNKTKELSKKVEDFIDFNFNSSSNNKSITLMPATQSKNTCPILYHHSAVLKLPTKRKSETILHYLQTQLKQIKIDVMCPPISWCKPVISQPDLKFNDLCVNQEPEISEIEKTETPIKTNMTLRTRRVKRKNYETVDSDEDFETTSIKKTKSNNADSNELSESPSTSKKSHSQKTDSDDDYCPTKSKKSKSKDQSGTVVVNKTTPVAKTSETTSKIKKWFPKIDVKKYTKSLLTPNVSDRTNKIFDSLKEEDNAKPKENSVKLDDTAELSDSDDIFPCTSSTVANIHNEVTPKLKRGKNVTKKPQTKTRRKINLKTTNEDKQENNANETQIPTTNFYGRNKENELDASNNNKSTTSKMTQCPICSKSFSFFEIEEHASRCEQFDEASLDSLCVICNKYILNVDMDAHKFVCLEKITEESVENSNDKNKNKSNLGFLCSVCDKYVIDCNQFQHASNCIATFK